MTDLTSREASTTQRKLDALRAKDFLPRELLDLVAETCRLQRETLDEITAQGKPEGVAGRALSLEEREQGLPQLSRFEFPVTADEIAPLFHKLLSLVREAPGPLGAGAAVLDAALASGQVTLAAALAAFLADDEAYFDAVAETMPQTPRLLPFLVQAAATPHIRRVAAVLAEHIDTTRAWPHGHCPACGASPLNARLKGKEGQRHLTCSFCQTEYRGPRLACVVCGEKDAEKLKYFDSPEEPGYRVDVCTGCGSYLKTTDFREMDRPSLPVLDDLESLALDLAARQQGYTRGGWSAWGF